MAYKRPFVVHKDGKLNRKRYFKSRKLKEKTITTFKKI